MLLLATLLFSASLATLLSATLTYSYSTLASLLSAYSTRLSYSTVNFSNYSTLSYATSYSMKRKQDLPAT